MSTVRTRWGTRGTAWVLPGLSQQARRGGGVVAGELHAPAFSHGGDDSPLPPARRDSHSACTSSHCALSEGAPMLTWSAPLAGSTAIPHTADLACRDCTPRQRAR